MSWAYIKRNVDSGEAQWFWTWLGWDFAAGFFKGFGLGFSWLPGELEVTLGCFAIGAVRAAGGGRP